NLLLEKPLDEMCEFQNQAAGQRFSRRKHEIDHSISRDFKAVSQSLVHFILGTSAAQNVDQCGLEVWDLALEQRSRFLGRDPLFVSAGSLQIKAGIGYGLQVRFNA